VTWGFPATDWETIVTPIEGDEPHVETRLKEGAQLVPDGVNDRAVIAFLVSIVQQQEGRIAELEAKIS